MPSYALYTHTFKTPEALHSLVKDLHAVKSDTNIGVHIDPDSLDLAVTLDAMQMTDLALAGRLFYRTEWSKQMMSDGLDCAHGLWSGIWPDDPGQLALLDPS